MPSIFAADFDGCRRWQPGAAATGENSASHLAARRRWRQPHLLARAPSSRRRHRPLRGCSGVSSVRRRENHTRAAHRPSGVFDVSHGGGGLCALLTSRRRGGGAGPRSQQHAGRCLFYPPAYLTPSRRVASFRAGARSANSKPRKRFVCAPRRLQTSGRPRPPRSSPAAEMCGIPSALPRQRRCPRDNAALGPPGGSQLVRDPERRTHRGGARWGTDVGLSRHWTHSSGPPRPAYSAHPSTRTTKPRPDRSR